MESLCPWKYLDCGGESPCFSVYSYKVCGLLNMKTLVDWVMEAVEKDCAAKARESFDLVYTQIS
jgi:hypothetical protein